MATCERIGFHPISECASDLGSHPMFRIIHGPDPNGNRTAAAPVDTTKEDRRAES